MEARAFVLPGFLLTAATSTASVAMPANLQSFAGIAVRNDRFSHRFSHAIEHRKVRLVSGSQQDTMDSTLRELIETSRKRFKTAAFNHSATSPRTASVAFMRYFRTIA